MAEHVISEDAADLVRNAGNAVVLVVTEALVETINRQALEESRDTGRHVSPGQVLDKALRMYLEAHGKPAAVEYLHLVASGGR